MKNNLEITITNNEFQDLIIHSERYAIGRRTYVVSNVCTTIKKYLPQLSNNTLSVLIRDIKHETSRNNLGDDCDVQQWGDLLTILEKEYEQRKGK